MGLPLFVAPVEKDVNLNKASGKDRVLAPSRSAIRRQPSSRERQNNPTRTTALRALGIPHPTLPPAPERYFPWVNSNVSVDPERRTVENHASEPWRAVLRDISRNTRPRETTLDEDTSPLFGGTWVGLGPPSSTRRDSDYRSIDLGRWPFEPLPRARRARVVTPVNNQHLNRRSDRRPRTINSPPPPPLGHPPEDSRQAAPAPRDQSATSSARTARATRDRTGASHDPIGRRFQLFRFTRSVDGLGDRDRSLSPDWDMLQTTLTPDPQPPSAGSSFASAVAVPQTANRIASVPPSASDRIEDAPLDPACESGCEMSDTEELSLEEYHRRMHRRRAELRQTGLRIPDFNLDGASEGPFARRSGSPSLPSDIAQRIARLQRQTDAWTGRLWDGPSEDETETDRSRQNMEDSVGVGQGAFAGDDDWTGMQRIVRSLAARGDIPDEWWAEVGLSRTLRQEETS